MKNEVQGLAALEEIALEGLKQQELDGQRGEALVADLNHRRMSLSKRSPRQFYAQMSQISSVLGTILLLLSFFWFIAANWLGMGLYVKLALVFSVFLGTNFGGAYLYFNTSKRFIGRLLILSGLVSFGVALILFGQAYNTNSEAYTLFIVWLLPTIVLYQITDFPSLPVFAIVLLNLAYWTFMQFEAEQPHWLGALVLNLLVTLPVLSARVRSTLKIWPFLASWVATILCLHVLSYYGVSREICYFWNFIFTLAVVASLYFFIKESRQPLFIGFSVFFACAHLLIKYVEICVYNFSDEILILSFFFGIILVGVEWVFVWYVNRLLDQSAQGVDATLAGQEADQNPATLLPSDLTDADPKGGSKDATKQDSDSKLNDNDQEAQS